MTGAGRLDLAGTPKTAWTRAAGSVAAGATELRLQTAPTGWQAGDDVSVAPTAAPDGGDFCKSFDETTVAGTRKSLLSGTRVRVQNGGSAFQLDAAGTKAPR
jgi:hypothetical protein